MVMPAAYGQTAADGRKEAAFAVAFTSSGFRPKSGLVGELMYLEAVDLSGAAEDSPNEAVGTTYMCWHWLMALTRFRTGG